MYDIIIVGSGPAGLTAGIYASRSRMKALLLSSQVDPSLITTTDLVENFPGFPEGITGLELIERLTRQAKLFGLEIGGDSVASLERVSRDSLNLWRVNTLDRSFETLSIILATGTQYAHLNVPGEKEYTGKGVSYCATCDGPFYRDAHVAVVGGGNTAVQEALFLTRFASRVTIIHRRDRLRATQVLQDRAVSHEKISFEWNAAVEEIIGDTMVKAVRIYDVGDPSEKKTLEVQGVFVFTGYIPNTAFARGVVECDENGYVVVDDQMKTSAQGVFACGDCTRKLLRQVITACGDGATAAYAAEQYVQEIKGNPYGTWEEP